MGAVTYNHLFIMTGALLFMAMNTRLVLMWHLKSWDFAQLIDVGDGSLHVEFFILLLDGVIAFVVLAFLFAYYPQVMGLFSLSTLVPLSLYGMLNKPIKEFKARSSGS